MRISCWRLGARLERERDSKRVIRQDSEINQRFALREKEEREREREMSWTDRGLLWRLLPVLKSRDLGKLGPAFGCGIGCGAGIGVGLIGGVGIGGGFPGLQFGFGMGAGCGIGIGFGYGTGKGVAYDEYRRHTNVGKILHRVPRSSSSQLEVKPLNYLISTRDFPDSPIRVSNMRPLAHRALHLPPDQRLR
ncbi:uncharacterized protein LOC144575526 isoform X2 [Carex rostrata]